jgi:nucleoside-diphosphate-sugar epimerase
MLAKGFAKHKDLELPVCIFAAGVSNSNCTQLSEFQRESDFIDQVSAQLPSETCLVYFSSMTTKVSESQQNYIAHKRRMEAKVRLREKHLIIRLGQVVGPSSNPSTLTNFLHTVILNGQAFDLWCGHSRNLLDLDDVVRATVDYLESGRPPSETVMLVNPVSHTIENIVQAFEYLTGRRALATRIDMPTIKFNVPDDLALHRLSPRIEVDFYLERTLKKYYG